MLVETNLRIANCKQVSGVRCQVSEFDPTPDTRHPTPRSAISLTEVLIAMGIMTVGLLGVASVFPVGTWYMEKAKVADQGSAIAQSVMSDIVTGGKLNPGAWLVMTPAPIATGPSATTSPNFRFDTVDGKYSRTALTQVAGKFVRPFSETLKEGLKLNSGYPSVLAKQFGNAYVIDPMFVAAASTYSGGTANVGAYAFPAGACYAYPWQSSTYYGTAGWNPWRAASSGDKAWPIRRATFQQSNGLALDKTMADSMSRSSDDLAYDFPQRDDRPAMQNWDFEDANNNGKPDLGESALARKWTGDYSWIASVVPTTNAARDGMARNPEGFAYDVSVVVFYKRSLPSTPPLTSTQVPDAVAHERSVSAAVISTGMNGGELLLTQQFAPNGFSLDSVSASPFDSLKAGQWIMLCAPHPNSSVEEPRFVLNWYQVLSIDKTGAGIPGFDSAKQRVVAVRGTEWPWQPRLSYPSSQQSSDVAKLSDDLCVGVFKGAVAVHTKTLRLESPLGGSYGSGTSMITPPGVTPGVVSY